jgi:hypothetical protein
MTDHHDADPTLNPEEGRIAESLRNPCGAGGICAALFTKVNLDFIPP